MDETSKVHPAPGSARPSRRWGRVARRAALLVLASAFLLALAGGPAVAATTTTTTTAATTTTTTAPATTTTTAPATTTTTAPATTTTTAPATTTTTRPATTTTTTAHGTSGSSVPAWVWILLAALVVIFAACVAVILAARRRDRERLAWVQRTLAVLDEVDSLALHLGSAEPAALATLAATDTPRLSALITTLRDLADAAPEGAHTEDLARVMAGASQLQNVLVSARLPGAPPAPADVQRAVATVNSESSTARAGIRRLGGG